MISEYPPGEPPVAWHFLQRNRIITGISNGLLVVEAPEKSGALNSARHAMEQGRDVFVVPGNVDTETCVGSNSLLEEQAIPALSGWHVVREYQAIYPDKVSRRDFAAGWEKRALQVAQSKEIPTKTDPLHGNVDKKSIDKLENSTYSVVNNLSAALKDDERRVLAHIGHDPCTIDDVIALTDMAPASVKAILTRLTIQGLLRNHPGGRVSRK